MQTPRPNGFAQEPSGESSAFAGRRHSDRPLNSPGGLAVGPAFIPPKLYRIGEVVKFAGVSRQTIHNYTTMGLLRECDWTPGGHRLYDESVFRRLAQIAELKSSGKSLRDVQRHFQRNPGMDA